MIAYFLDLKISKKIELYTLEVGCGFKLEKIRSANKFIFNIKCNVQVIIVYVIGAP